MVTVLGEVVVVVTNWFQRFVRCLAKARSNPHLSTSVACSPQDAAIQGLLLSASLALQAIPTNAVAETVPEKGVISFKYLDYKDWQASNHDTSSIASSTAGRNRIHVKAQSQQLSGPLAGEWLVTGTYTADAISGATPKFYDSYLTKMSDHRDAGSILLKKYFHRGTVSLGANVSSENDYLSRGYALSGTLDSESKNTVFNFGVAVTNDDINPTGHRLDYVEHKHTLDWILGVTQVLTADDILQLNLGVSDAQGYLSDPYKTADDRPRKKNHYTVSARWNHYFDKLNGIGHLGYRYYTDSFDINGHTLTMEYDQILPHGWTISPLLRFYTQSAADFYAGPNNFDPSRYLTLDQRMSAFGAVTYGVKFVKQLDPDWTVDFKYEAYKQKHNWSLSGSPSGDIDAFYYRAIQFGVSRRF